MTELAQARVPFPSFALRLGFLYAALFLVVGCYLPYLPVWLHWRNLDADEIAGLLATPLFIRILFTPAISFAADLLGAGARSSSLSLGGHSPPSYCCGRLTVSGRCSSPRFCLPSTGPRSCR
jgi:hypothetical protein